MHTRRRIPNFSKVENAETGRDDVDRVVAAYLVNPDYEVVTAEIYAENASVRVKNEGAVDASYRDLDGTTVTLKGGEERTRRFSNGRQAVYSESLHAGPAFEALSKIAENVPEPERWRQFDSPPTTSWGSAVTTTGWYRLIGDTAEIKLRVTPQQSVDTIGDSLGNRILYIKLPPQFTPLVENVPFQYNLARQIDDVGSAVLIFGAKEQSIFAGRCLLANNPAQPPGTENGWQLAPYFVYASGSFTDPGGNQSTKLEEFSPADFRNPMMPKFNGNDCCFEIHVSFRVER